MSPRPMDEPCDADGEALDRSLIFRAGRERYGLPLARVREVAELVTEPRPLPAAPDWLAGVVTHQGRVEPVVRADRLLHGERGSAGRQLVFVQLDADRLALLVDQVEAIERVHAEGPPLADGRRRAWLRGRMLTLLRPASLWNAIQQRLAER